MSTTQKELNDTCRSIAETIEKMTPEEFKAWTRSSVLETNYLVSCRKEYIGAELLVAYGGPTITVKTRENKIEGTWAGDKYSCIYSNDKLDNYMFERYMEL